MEVVVVGVGAIGSVYLAFLTKGGHRSVGVVRGKLINEISVEGIWGSFRVPVRTVRSVDEVGYVWEGKSVAVKDNIRF